jgi:hypothetical protein
MDEDDETYLQDYNKQHPGELLSEDLFEKIMWECESIANQQWPHLDLVTHLSSFYYYVINANFIIGSKPYS